MKKLFCGLHGIMEKPIKSISGDEFKLYATQTRACKIHKTCELESKFGILKLDFAGLGTIKKCTIYVRKTSGNGKIIAISGNKSSEHNIVSKTSQYFSIDVESNSIELHRPTHSVGALEIIKIDLFSDDLIEHNMMIETLKWKKILSLCSEHKLIKLVDGKLFAAEGAIIKAGQIHTVFTNPPNQFTINGDTVKFIGSCEILDLKIDSNRPAATQAFPHLAAPTPIVPSSPVEESVGPGISAVQKIIRNEPTPTPIAGHHILYDTDKSGYFAGVHTNHSAEIAPNKRSVKLDHRGSFFIPISNIQPNTNYTCIVYAQKLVGNGKLSVSLFPNDAAKPPIIFLSPHVRNINVALSTGSGQQDEYHLIVERPDSATGQVVINRLMLLENSHARPTSVPAERPVAPAVNYKFEISNDFHIIENDMNKAFGEYVMPNNENIKFTIVIPSYKNAKWVEKNLTSVFEQSYQNYRVIFVDDCSPDDTFTVAKNIVEKFNKQDCVTLTRNSERQGALCNLYNSIHSCDDNEIVVTLDGDDWFAHNEVLTKLQSVYSNSNVWLTYGQYKSYPDNGAGCSRQIPPHITQHGAYRQYGWCSSHLRTFYSWLFKKIKKEDLLDKNGKFYPMAWDLAFQFPMLEMGGQHCVFIPDVLYIYNVENPINDSKVNLQLQQSLEREIRAKRKYDRL